MDRQKAEKVVQALVNMRATATDAVALSNPDIYPEWKADRFYVDGERILYSGTLYKVLQAHTSQADWTPDEAPSLFAEVLIPDSNVIPEWKQPDSTNPYAKGDKVTHNGKTWESTVDGNVWEPGIYGWQEVPA